MTDIIPEIACEKLPDGSLFLADVDIQAAGPLAVAFVNRMAGYWERDDARRGWITGVWKVFDEDAPNSKTEEPQ